MPEREHFTNGRCFAFATGLALVGTSFGVHVGGWHHWITIGIGYGVGVVLMLLAAVQITKSYYSRHPGLADETPAFGVSHDVVKQSFAVQFPRLAVEVSILQAKGLAPTAGVILHNVGGSEAHKLQIAEMLIHGHWVTFPANISVLAPGEKTPAITPTVKNIGPLRMHDFIGVMADDWDTQCQLQGTGIVETLRFPASATYEDYEGRSFQASWQFEFHVIRYGRWRARIQNHSDQLLPDNLGPYVTVPKIETKVTSENS